MASTAVTAAVSLPSKSSSLALSSRTSISSSDRITLHKPCMYPRNVSSTLKSSTIRAQVTTEAPAKVVKESKKNEEGVVTNKYKPKTPYIGKCLLNTKITGDDAPGETWHMVFSTEGEIPYREGQSVGVIPDGIDKNGKPHKLRLYSIASSAIGDFGDSKTILIWMDMFQDACQVFDKLYGRRMEAKPSKMKDLLFVKKSHLPIFTSVITKDKLKDEWNFEHQQECGYICQFVNDNIYNHIPNEENVFEGFLTKELPHKDQVSLCVKRLVYNNDQGEIVKGVCSNFLCDLKPGADVKLTGPVGKEMLMPKDPNATIIMLGTGTGIAPFRSFLWKMFFEKHEDYKFNGLAWLFLGVPTSSSLLYKEEFEKMKEKSPDNFRLDFAVSREQTNSKGEKMYIQTRMAEYAEELWELLKKDNTFVYMCGLKGMEKGIDDIMLSLAARDGIDWLQYKRDLKKAEQWNVEVY